MARIPAYINPDILAWSREQAGLDPIQAGKKASVSVDRYASWETGDAQPTLRQLRLLARAFRRPTAFFYRSTLPPAPPGLPDYRLIPDTGTGESPALRYEIRRARSRRDTALDLFRSLGEEPPDVDLHVNRQEGAARIASRLREFLGVSLDQQYAWRSHYEALRDWISATESTGVFVFQFSGVEVDEARGFSLSERPLPIVALNGKDSPRGRIFTLFHELAHIALDLSGLCDLQEGVAGDWVEPFCNAVAGEALVPTDTLLTDPLVLRHTAGPHWTDEALRLLANRYMVSRETMLRRILALELTTPDFYALKRTEFLEEYRRLRGESGGFLRYFVRVLRDNGQAYTTLLLSAYDQQAITVRDLSHYLGDVKLKHVDSIRGVLTSSVD